jgi:hypothetical protein
MLVAFASVGLCGLCLGATASVVTASAGPVTAAVLPAPSVERAAFRHYGDLAFMSEGGLWALDGATGRLSLLAPANKQPSLGQFSPNGRWLSYSLGSGEVWVAGADGSSPRPVISGGGGQWLPDGDLVAGGYVWHIPLVGSPERTGALPNGLVAWSPAGDRFVFESDSLGISQTKPSSGTDRLEVSGSLSGRRVTWYQSKVSFSSYSGAQGNFLGLVLVLPHKQGIVFTLDPDRSASLAADGLGLYDVRSPGGAAPKLGTTVGDTVALGPSGTFAFTNGPNRYAWVTKSVVTCSASSATCSSVPAPAGELTVGPALSPNGAMLAFEEAPTSSASSFYQPTVQRWYAAHTLWVLREGERTPVEVRGAQGASAPVWSAESKSLMYVADNSLWLLTTLSGKPVRIESPLFTPSAWPSYYGQVNWAGQFAWSSPR